MPEKIIIFIPSIEDGGVEKNLFIISNYLSKKTKIPVSLLAQMTKLIKLIKKPSNNKTKIYQF